MKAQNILRIVRSVFNTVLQEPSNELLGALFDETNLWYPLDDDKILSRLRGEHNTADLDEYFRLSGQRNIVTLFREYRSCLANKSLNPHKEYESLRYWVEPRKVTRFLDEQILEYSEHPVHTHIFHIGERGVGKTITQNAWLHTRFDEIERRKIFWVRCDGYKLYKLWLERDIHSPTTLEDYLDMQLLYVFSKYLETDFFSQIYSTIKQEKATFQRLIGKVFDNFEDADMASYVNKFRRNLLTYESARSAIDEKSSYALYILKEAQSRRTGIDRARWNWISLSKKLQNFLLEHGYKILQIVDGADNINLSDKETKPLYERFIAQISDFIYSGTSPQVIKMVSLRERTSIDVKVRRAQMALPDKERDDIRVLEIKHSSPNFNEIYQKRWRYIQTIVQDTLEDLGEEFNLSILSKVDKEFSARINAYYHNNVSTFLYNDLTLRMMIYYRWLQVNRAVNFSYESYARLFRSRNLFLNGHFYLHSKPVPSSSVKKGLFSCNIFYAEPNSRGHSLSSRWQGLCAVRILQLLKSLAPYKVSEESVVKYVRRQFDYSSQQIMKTVSLCKNYGLVDTKFFEQNDKHIYLEISAKGDYLLDLVFSDLDVLYTLSLDTYLPSKYRDLIRVHSNKIYRETEYASSAVVTTFLFLLFIMYVHRQEMNRFDKHIKVNGVREVCRDAFQLPLRKHLLHIVKRAHQLYKTASNEEKERIDNFFEIFRERLYTNIA